MKPLTSLRHELHTLAEVSGREEKTSAFITNQLANFNPSNIISGLGGFGVAAVFSGSAPGPTVLLRCELDALPIPESSIIDYASLCPGISHKCGHDGHMAILLGVGEALYKNPPSSGNVVLLFQPAEETGQGANLVLLDANFSGIKPDYVFALHNLPGFDKGTIILKKETFASASIGMIAELEGATSHAGEPEKGISPALAIARLIQDLSAIPQFHSGLSEAAKVTIIHARLGEVAFGTSPGVGKVLATLRTHTNESLARLKEQCSDHVLKTAESYNLKSTVSWVEEFPATVNSEDAVSIVEKSAAKNGYPVHFLEKAFPWSEDFGHFTNRYPGALFGLGAGLDHPALHNPKYDFPDELIKNGVNMFKGIFEELLNR